MNIYYFSAIFQVQKLGKIRGKCFEGKHAQHPKSIKGQWLCPLFCALTTQQYYYSGKNPDCAPSIVPYFPNFFVASLPPRQKKREKNGKNRPDNKTTRRHQLLVILSFLMRPFIFWPGAPLNKKKRRSQDAHRALHFVFTGQNIDMRIIIKEMGVLYKNMAVKYRGGWC